jgi:hypothetical protein
LDLFRTLAKHIPDYLFYLWQKKCFPRHGGLSRTGCADITDEVFRAHHELIVLVHAKVADVSLGILVVVDVEVLGTNAEVRLVVNHHLKRVETVNKDPLPYIKFSFVY